MDKQNLEQIKQLSPLAELPADKFDALLADARIVNLPAGKMIFKRDQVDTQTYWLLAGAIDLLDEKFDARNRSAEDDASRFPIDNNNPHILSAITTVPSSVLIVDGAAHGLSQFGAGAGAAEEDVDDGVDWMSTLLSSPLFEFIPPANIQSLFSKFEEVKYAQGEAVIRQGETGDYFYVLQSGRAKVERTANDKVILLAELRAGDNFGQDALVSSIARNATVTMVTSGKLMRLSQPDFESLLMKPVIETVSAAEATEMIQLGEPRTFLLDVRNPKEYEADKQPGSLNVPLLLLRKNLNKLKQDAIYITRCDNGKRSTLASYILNENGFTAYVLANQKKGDE
jgi:CRP-like cAMP-binding protein